MQLGVWISPAPVTQATFRGCWYVWECGAAALGRRAAGGRQPGVQETDGQFQLPLCWIVTPQLLPLPFGLATSCWALG